MLLKFQASLTSPVDYSLLKSYRAADHSKVQTGTLKTFYAIDLDMEGTSMNHWAELLQDYLESYNSISVEICFRITTNQLLWKICCLVIESKLVVLYFELKVAYKPNRIYLLFVSAPPLGPSGLSGRSSVSSLASSSSMGSHHHHHHQQSLNQALAIVANKWDREQRRQEQEVTRKLTLLKQRKVSAVLKVSAL